MKQMTNAQEIIAKRMRRIGSKKNFSTKSQAKELKENKDLIRIERSSEGGIEIVDLTLEPNKFDELSSTTRLTFDEFCDAINDVIEEEEDDWKSLRMKDQINMTRDKIIAETIVKHAREELGINTEHVSGQEISYNKRFDEDGSYLGEAITVSLTYMPMYGATIK